MLNTQIVYLQSKGIATLEDLDAALSSVDEEAKRLNTSVVAKQKRMRTLEKFIEHGRVGKIAKDFAVSKQVILHCLWELNIISQPFYYETLNRYSDEYKAYKAQKPKKGFLPPVTDTVSQVGKLYARTVLNAYYAEKITARDTSSYLLNLKAKNFGKLERWCF